MNKSEVKQRISTVDVEEAYEIIDVMAKHKPDQFQVTPCGDMTAYEGNHPLRNNVCIVIGGLSEAIVIDL